MLYLDRENPQGMVSERSSGAGILANAKFNYWGEWEPEPLPEPDDPRLLEFAAQGGFIVFDSLQDWYPPNFNEIDNAKIVELMRKFRRLTPAWEREFLCCTTSMPLANVLVEAPRSLG